MVTAELAACLPVLVLVLAVALSAVEAVSVRVQVQDVAREAVRAAARGDQLPVAPGFSVVASNDDAGARVTATATRQLHLLASWLPSVTITETATAATEPAG